MGPSWVQGIMEAGEMGRDEQVGVDSVEYGLGMTGGTKTGEGIDGNGKKIVEVSGDGLEKVGLRDKGNGPSQVRGEVIRLWEPMWFVCNLWA